ncbi:MAG TPA: hypothetical protein VM165_00160 [Planctomycetaceae bacterium]|nr:hypothetical protein [Planctomycetaceae bacterium]
MLPSPSLSGVGQEIRELRSRLVGADEQQARFINRQILHRLATRISFLEAEMALLGRSATSPAVAHRASA